MAKEWLTIQPSLEPIMKPIKAVIKTIDSVLAFLIALLNIAQVILNIIKAFLIGLLNPIRPIIEAIIAEIRQIISDLRQAGLYLADDAGLFEVKPVTRIEELRGGFSSYERRMLKRLLNRSDPTRPDISSSSAVIAMFAYVSSGDIFALIELIMRIKAFFGGKGNNPRAPFPPPTTPTMKFGTDGLNLAKFRGAAEITAPPDAVVLSWSMPSTGTPFSRVPYGFLVHVSTVPDGFGVQTAFVPTDVLEVESTPTKVSVAIDTTTGAELRLYGGVSDLHTGDSYRSIFTNGDSNPHAARLFLALDQNTPLIPPSKLTKETTPYGAATYYFTTPLGPLGAVVGGGVSYSCKLRYDDLPKQIEVSSTGGQVSIDATSSQTFYVRVRPVTKKYADAAGLSGKKPSLVSTTSAVKPVTIIKESVISNAGALVLKPDSNSGGDTNFPTIENIGPASQATVVSFPTADMMDFVNAVKTSLAVLILCRADLKPTAEVEIDGELVIQPGVNTYEADFPTGLEGLTDLMVEMRTTNLFFGESEPNQFAKRVVRRVRGLANDFFESPPSSGVIESLKDKTDLLNNFKWSDIDPEWPDLSIWEMLQNTGSVQGIAGRPSAFGENGQRRLRRGALGTEGGKWISRSPYLPIRLNAITGEPYEQVLAEKAGYIDPFMEGAGGYSDFCPVLYRVPLGKSRVQYELYIQFVRNLLLSHEGGEILNAASSVLTVAGAARAVSPTTGNWVPIRFLDEALAPVDAILVDIEKFLLAILDALQGIIDKIIAYIEAIQARIYQLQQLIEMIRALLRSLTLFELPSFSGLVLVENGTDGIATGLITAGNKPADGPAAYGGGAVVLFGGLPSVLLETLALVLGGGGGD